MPQHATTRVGRLTGAGVVSLLLLGPAGAAAAAPRAAAAPASSAPVVVPGTQGLGPVRALAVGPDGSIYETHPSSSVIHRVATDGTVSSVRGNGVVLPGQDPLLQGLSPGLSGLALDRQGDLFVADAGYRVVHRITPSGQSSVVAGDGGSGHAEEGPALRVSFASPTGVAVDGVGNVYVSDEDNRLVLKVTSSGALITHLGLRPAQLKIYGDILDRVTGVSTDAAGRLYLVQGGAGQFGHAGSLLRSAGAAQVTHLMGPGEDTGPGAALTSGLTDPVAVAVDAKGNTYVTSESRTAVITADGQFAPLDLPVPTPRHALAVDADGGLLVGTDDGVVRIASPLPSALVPAAPHLTALPGDGSVTVRFPRVEDGGSPVTGYEVNLDEYQSLWLPLRGALPAADGTITARVGGPTNGTRYPVSVRARNALGAGVVSQTVWVVPAVFAPYVRQVYLDLLGRLPDEAGATGWAGALGRGASRDSVANAITASSEFRGRLVDAAYRRYLDRPAEPGGQQAWVAAMGRGLTIEDLETGIASSAEAYARAGGTDSLWTTALYRQVLQREPAGAEVAAWADLVRRTGNRALVARSFLYSTERLRAVVEQLYVDLLRRPTDAPGRDAWVDALRHGMRREQLVAGLVASEEYLARSRASSLS